MRIPKAIWTFCCRGWHRQHHNWGRAVPEKQNPNIKVVAVEPASSPVLSKGWQVPHKIQGIGAGFVPDILDTGIYDEILPVSNEDAFATGRLIGRTEGGAGGGSPPGAAVFAAIQLAKRPENQGKTIVVLLPDTGDRYLSTPFSQTNQFILIKIRLRQRYDGWF